MCGVIAIVEANPITLSSGQERVLVELVSAEGRAQAEGQLTITSIIVMLVLKSEFGSISSTSACWPQLPTIRAKRSMANGNKNTNVLAFGLSLVM